MDAIVLAGGRGRRMGALTANRNKGSLAYLGKPSVVRTLEHLVRQHEIEKIYVATSYRAETVYNAIAVRFPIELMLGKIRVVEHPAIVGDLKRFATVLTERDILGPAYLCGIDTVVDEKAVDEVIARRIFGPWNATMLCSPHLEIAPTHSRLLVENGIVQSIARPADGEMPQGSAWRVSLTHCIFGEALIEDIKRSPPSEPYGITRVLPRVWENGGRIRAIETGQFVHLAHGHDFMRKVA